MAVDTSLSLREVEHPRPWFGNVWCGIVGDKVIVPHVIDCTLTVAMYRHFLTEELSYARFLES